jgi:hypothetical protein
MTRFRIFTLEIKHPIYIRTTKNRTLLPIDLQLTEENTQSAPMQSSKPQVAQTQKKSSVILRTTGIIGITAGLILIFSGYTSHPIVLTILNYVDQHYASSLSSMELLALKLAITFFELVVALGGIVIVTGGVLLLLMHRTSGRILIWLGGGMGIFGLLFMIGEAYYYSHFSLVVFHAEYWVGLILATVAFLIAKRG